MVLLHPDLNCVLLLAPTCPPGDIATTALSSTSIILTWSPPPMSCQNGIIREYRINVTEVETGRVLVFVSTSTTLTLSSLHPYYTYQCIVSAYTVGVGPYADNFTVVTLEDGMHNGC